MRKARLAIIAALYLVAPAMAQSPQDKCDAFVKNATAKGLTVTVSDYAQCYDLEKKRARYESEVQAAAAAKAAARAKAEACAKDAACAKAKAKRDAARRRHEEEIWCRAAVAQGEDVSDLQCPGDSGEPRYPGK